MTAYYNENDKNAAAWLRELIRSGHLPTGEVDDRSIVEVGGQDLAGFDDCHFFAGIGGWPYALRLAGWEGPVWTGSCPCQPFSAAGKRRGTADERHLWPEFHRLIAECRPATVFGEQVASKDGREWLAGVRTDLEALGYAVGASDLCAAGAGAPHIRQRLFWLADAGCTGDEHWRHDLAGTPRDIEGETHKRQRVWSDVGDGLDVGWMGDTDEGRRDPRAVLGQREAQEEWPGRPTARSGVAHGMGDTIGARLEEWAGGRRYDETQRTTAQRAGDDAFWRDAIWLPCLDGKARRIEPGSFPLAHGVPARMGRLRGYGNAIVPQVAAEFIKASRA